MAAESMSEKQKPACSEYIFIYAIWSLFILSHAPTCTHSHTLMAANCHPRHCFTFCRANVINLLAGTQKEADELPKAIKVQCSHFCDCGFE